MRSLLHPELQTVADDLNAAQRRLHALAPGSSESDWACRPEPGRWSAAECVAHLNLTGAAYVPLLAEALERARQLPERRASRYRRDLAGWLLWKSMGPPVRIRVKTTAPFVPTAGQPRAALIAEFDRLQLELSAVVAAADGLALGRVRVASPFSARVTYNLYACLSIVARHQHRHLWQAEQTLRRLGGSSEPAPAGGRLAR